MKKQTAGHDRLGDFAPEFAKFNDDILFGEVWSRERQLSEKKRSMITIAALMTNGDYEQLQHHLQHGKDAGITKEEIVEIITQLAFYVGWPKAWSTFNLAKEIWKD